MITKQELKQFRIDFEEAVRGLEKQYNLDIRLGTISFTNNDFSAKFTATKTTEKAQTQLLENVRKNFAMYAKAHGFDPEWFGKTFLSANGTMLTVTGYNSRAKKYPITLEGDDGRHYKMSVHMLKINMQREAMRS